MCIMCVLLPMAEDVDIDDMPEENKLRKAFVTFLTNLRKRLSGNPRFQGDKLD